MTRIALPNRRSRASSCSIIALATVLVAGASPAAAQSFQGTGTFATNTGGAANISTGSGTTDITVNPGQTVIDWAPTPDGGASGTAINFQPSGTTATFNSADNYAVLNRINVSDNSRIVALNGTIQSLIGSDLTGGSIFFYSPSGFVLGSSAVINVGSLVLSASPITVDGQDNFISNGVVQFGQAPNASALVYTNPGSQITALNEGSYVALVAPRVEHHGSINVNGQAVLVGAEAATINFRAGGLFDIQVDVGTTDANGVVVDGTITGPESAGGTDDHRAYLVAVPKNTALTMLIGAGADLGFDIAGAADVVGNAVILSAGQDISFGSVNQGPSAASGADADFSIGNANFTSAFYGTANGDALAGAVDGSLTFASDASLRGRDTVRLEAGGGGIVSVAGDLRMSADATGTAEGQSVTAGNVFLQALAGGSLSVTGDAVLTAIGEGGSSFTPGVAAGDGTGGTILVQSTSGGGMSLGSLDADVGGYGGLFNGDIDGGDGRGGTINVFTSGGSSMSVTGSTFLRADGRASLPSDCSSCGGLAGLGQGGTVNVQAHSLTGNTMDFGDVLFVWANGYGGDAQAGDGGLGHGGAVTLSSSDGSIVTVATDVSIQADGWGGGAFGGSGNGGDGIGGGNVQTFAANGGSLQITGNFITSVDGIGGQSESATGGTGIGGLGQLFATTNGDVTVGSFASISTTGRGGDGLIGGDGTGGDPSNGGGAYYSSSSGGSLTITSFAELIANGRGGDAFDADNLGGDAGDGQGGHAEAYANGGTLAFDSALLLEAEGQGGSAGALQAHSGDGFGGDIFLQSIGGGTLTVAQSLFAFADGTGGSPNFGVYSGNGTGGTITVVSRDGTSSLTVSGPATLEADGYAGFFSECSTACSNGGIGQGGDIFIGSSGVLTGATLDFDFSLFASADGYGGDSAIIDPDSNVTIDGGEGIGGSVTLFANDGNSVSVADLLTLEAIGYGGYDSANLVGGTGTGGDVHIFTNSTAGNLITLGFDVVLIASGHGGDSGIISGGDGGDGIGGIAEIFAAGGNVNIAGSASLAAVGEGGEAFGGIGGDGFGGQTLVGSNGGAIHILTNLFMDGAAIGGDGDTGGNAVGLVSDPLDETQPISAAVYTGSAGSITVDGSTQLSGQAEGGDGANGNGGNASGGEVDVVSFFGDIALNSLSVGVSAYGGSGGNGGNGGDAQAGNVDVAFGFGAAAVGGTITLGSAFILADGFGGAGGAGTSANSGGNGGAGGDGTGGNVLFTGNAAGGTLDSGAATITARGEGGTGGDGGNGIDGTGGAGGAGGLGHGGFIQTGTVSADQAPGSGGGATYTTLSQDTGGFGGAGGNGGTGGGGDGAGGDGGDAFGGSSVFLVRGVLVSADNVQLFSGATGGDGGTGSAQGNGGDATTGIIRVESKDRFGHPGERGTLNVGTIIGVASAAGGNGAVNGTSSALGGSYFRVLNGDATIGSFTFTITGNVYDPSAGPNIVSVRDGTATIGIFSFDTSGELVLDASNGSMAADSITLSAGTFVPDTFNPTPPTSPGTYFADTFDITTGGDFITNANLDSTNGLAITAPGLILAADINSGDFIVLDAGTSLTFGDLDAVSDINLDAGTSISGGNSTAGAGFEADALGGSITLGTVDSVDFLVMHAQGDVTTGDLDSGDGNVWADAQAGSTSVGNVSGGSVDLTATGGVSAGDVTSTIDWVFARADSGPLSLGDVNAADFVDLNSGSSIAVGNIIGSSVDLTAAGAITAGDVTSNVDWVVAEATGGSLTMGDVNAASFAGMTSGTSIDVGNVTAGTNIGATSGGNMNFADLNAGNNVILDSGASMTLGNVTAQAGSVQATAVDVLSFLSISAGTFVTIDPTAIVGGDVTALAGDVSMTGDSIDIGNVSASDNVILTALAGDLSTLNIDAGLDVTLDASGDVTTGDITAGGLIDATGASLTLGNLVANSIDLTTTVADLTVGDVTIPGNLALTTAGDLVFGNLSAFDVDLASTLSMTGGNINSTTGITAQSGTTMSLGNLIAGGNVSATGASLDLGDVSGGTLDFTSTVGNISTGDLVAFFSLNVDSAGDFLFGSIIAPLVDLNAPGSIIGGDIDSDTDIFAVAGGDIDVGDLSAGGTTVEGFQDGSVQLTAGGFVNTGLMDAFGSVGIDAGDSVDTSDINALTTVDILAVNDIDTGNISAGDGVAMNAGGSIGTGDIDAASIDLFADGDIATGDLNTQLLALALGGEIGALLFPGASVTLEAGGNISTGDINSIDGVYANAGGGISTGAIDAIDFVQLAAGTDALTGAITAGSFIDIFTTAGGITTGDLGGTEIDLDAGGDIVFADVDADSIDFSAGGAVSGGNIDVDSFATGDADGAITLGDITAGPTIPVDDFSVGIASATSIIVGDVSGAGPVGFATIGDLTTGNLSSGNLVMTLVGGDIVTGSITTPSDGRVYMGDVSMFLEHGGTDDFNAAAVLVLDPVATGGSITIGGPVSTGLFQAAAGTALSALAIDADSISASAGGTATVGGTWNAGDVQLTSNDIDITANGSINAGDIDLVSTSATHTIVGDGVQQAGYHLSDAEFDRLHANDINVIADTALGAAPSMFIGDLSADASGGQGGVEYEFRTYNSETEVGEGSIRILGDAIFTGMGADDAVGFLTGTFELDAATGLLSLEGSPGTLGGNLVLNAAHIHVASGAILDQLAIDPQYDGYQDDLNAPAAVQRPDGVLRAANIEIEFGDAALNTLYVQNTGTSENPAGFLVSDAVLFGDGSDVTPPPGSIDLIINGQIVTQGGTLTGIAVRDAQVAAEVDLSPFTANSTINGCLLVGACGPVVPPEPPIPPDFQPSPGIQKEVTLITDNLLPPPDFGNEDFIDDNDEETDEGSTSPIEPPDPLFDTSELGEEGGTAGPEVGTSMRSNSGLTEPGDVDDPVSGSGNPALMETTPTTPNQEKQQ